MPKLTPHLDLPRCPHCAVRSPNLYEINRAETTNHTGTPVRRWRFYQCRTCGGIVTAWSPNWDQEIVQVFPDSPKAHADIPERPRTYLEQALESQHSPAGAVMLAASAVDAMLRLHGYKEGSLYNRINEAVKKHLITEDMAKWAHDVRLEANDQRHPDEAVELPNQDDARRVIDFATALAQLLFVLPSQVKRGIVDAEKKGN